MLDLSSFARLVHEVYLHLYDRAYLEHHPLTRLLGGGSPASAEDLHRLLTDAIGWLRPLGSSPSMTAEWRRYRHLQLRYLEGESTERIAHRLHVSGRQARRDHLEALDEVARLLWQRFILPGAPGGYEPGARETTPPPGVASDRPIEAPRDRLDAELSILTARAISAPTNLDELIRGAVETVGRLARAHDVEVSVDYALATTPVKVNRAILRQLLLNLLSDAIVRSRGSKIRISVLLGEHEIELRLHLQPAAQRDPTENPPRGVAEQQGAWEVDASSDIFGVSLRLAQSQGITLRRECRPDGVLLGLTLLRAHSRALLVVDDNPDVALLFERFVAELPYLILQARSGERALQLTREFRPEVIFLDLLMPSQDGWEILQTLRSDPEVAGIPVVVCSVVPDRALAHSLGVNDFLPKPVTRAALLEVLTRVQGTRPDIASRAQPESTELPRPRAGHPRG